MPKGFTEREKAIIRERLLEAGQASFEKAGIRKTSVEDLTRAAGISKGAFYLFFDSKEELFFEVMERFEGLFRGELFGALQQDGKAPRQELRDFLQHALSAWRANPLFTHFGREEYEYLVRKLPEERLRTHIREDDLYVGELIERWQARGVYIQPDPQLVSGLIKALFFVSLHAGEIGQETYPQAMQVLVDLVSGYLLGEVSGG